MSLLYKNVTDLIDRLLLCYSANALILNLLIYEGTEPLLMAIDVQEGSELRVLRSDGSYYAGIDLWQVIKQTKRNPAFGLDFLSLQLMTIISAVGTVFAEHDYFDQTPELEFLRHLHQGVLHGNSFYLADGEPKRLAKFGDFEITADLHGQTIFFEFLMPGDIFDLFDNLKNHLQEMTAKA